MNKKPQFQKAAIPENEDQRLASLYSLNILNTPPEERFDRITRLALTLFKVSISTVTLVDSKKEWYKSCQGLPKREGNRAISFCAHTILAQDVFIIPDTKKDARFAENPMVIGKPYIRFYAAVPLKSADGQRVGAFCIKDRKPRKLTLEKIELLKTLAAWVETELNTHELTSALEARRQTENKLSEVNNVLKLLNQLLRHDLLNHLTVIKGNLSYLMQGKNSPEKIMDIDLATDQSTRLIEQIGRLESTVSKGTYLQPINLKQIIGNILSDFPKVKVQIQQDLNVLADEALEPVIENIIMNASTHGQTDKISIKIDKKDGFVNISIIDFGVGIPSKIKSKLFTEGFKYGTTGNHGLGLYIAKKTVQRYGGDIAVKDNKPKGTIFIISLKKA